MPGGGSLRPLISVQDSFARQRLWLRLWLPPAAAGNARLSRFLQAKAASVASAAAGRTSSKRLVSHGRCLSRFAKSRDRRESDQGVKRLWRNDHEYLAFLHEFRRIRGGREGVGRGPAGGGGAQSLNPRLISWGHPPTKFEA